MDFGDVLKAAKQNDANKNGPNYYKTKFEPPKKEPKGKTLSNNIQKFLAKKEEEERQKAEEARIKRERFLAMRDQKTTNKIKKMLKVTKSANRSVLEDAVDNDNTAVTMHGPEQPDEDDYGYVSQEASAYYSRMMEKYKKMPDEEKFSERKKKMVHGDLSSTKDRVRAAILRQQEEELLPHKRKKRSHTADDIDNVVEEPPRSERDEKPKPKRPPPPPPLDFNSLLKIAEKKQFEPVVVETKKSDSIEEPERLMTKKQKREYEEQRAYREAKLRREKERSLALAGKSETSKPKTDPVSKPTNSASMRIPKIGDKRNIQLSERETLPSIPKIQKLSIAKANNELKRAEDVNKNKIIPNKQSSSLQEKGSQIERQKTPSMANYKSQPQLKSKEADARKHVPTAQNSRTLSSNDRVKENINITKREQFNAKEKQMYKGAVNRLQDSGLSKQSERYQNAKPSSFNKNDRNQTSTSKSSPSVNGSNRPISKPETSSKDFDKGRKLPSGDAQKSRQFPPADTQKARQFSPADVQKTRQFPPADVQKTRQFPPNDVQKTRQFPPADVQKTRQFPPPDVRKSKPMSREEKLRRDKLKKRRIDDDESEYDSSLDDFIDDGPEEGGDVSKYIKEIFGYDKSRYKDAEFDDKNMESNFSQVMREEYISKRIGIMEDLEDMRMEAMEKKKKTQKHK